MNCSFNFQIASRFQIISLLRQDKLIKIIILVYITIHNNNNNSNNNNKNLIISIHFQLNVQIKNLIKRSKNYRKS